jgi:site-specific recombinase XerC
MNIGIYQLKLSDWMCYKKYSQESIKNYVSCLGKFLKHFDNEATKPSTDINLIQRIAGHNNVKTTMIYAHISHNLISKIQSLINQIRL